MLEWKRATGYVHNTEIACSLLQKFQRYERRDRLAQVDTINEDVGLPDCVIRARLNRFVLSRIRGQLGSLCVVRSGTELFTLGYHRLELEGAQDSTDHVPFQNLFLWDASLSAALESLRDLRLASIFTMT